MAVRVVGLGISTRFALGIWRKFFEQLVGGGQEEFGFHGLNLVIEHGCFQGVVHGHFGGFLLGIGIMFAFGDIVRYLKDAVVGQGECPFLFPSGKVFILHW